MEPVITFNGLPVVAYVRVKAANYDRFRPGPVPIAKVIKDNTTPGWRGTTGELYDLIRRLGVCTSIRNIQYALQTLQEAGLMHGLILNRGRTGGRTTVWHRLSSPEEATQYAEAMA